MNLKPVFLMKSIWVNFLKASNKPINQFFRIDIIFANKSDADKFFNKVVNMLNKLISSIDIHEEGAKNIEITGGNRKNSESVSVNGHLHFPSYINSMASIELIVDTIYEDYKLDSNDNTSIIKHVDILYDAEWNTWAGIIQSDKQLRLFEKENKL